MNQHPDADRWARLRFAIIGPLLAAPPAGGELRRALQALAQRHWQHPRTGQPVQFSYPTLERWYYAARRAQDPVAVLRRRRRQDAGRSRQLSPALIQALEQQYHDRPSWSVQLHYDNLTARAKEEPALGPVPSYNTVRRYLKAQGLHRQPRPVRRTQGAEQAAQRRAEREVRSFEADQVHGLWHLDFHHGSKPVLTRAGRWVKPLLLGVLDDHSRLVCHLQWYLSETTEVLVHGLCQALQKRALPRALMTDNGAAMQAEEFQNGLHRLSIVHETTLPYSPYQNAKQESFWATVEGRLMAMLEGVAELSLERLNLLTQAWVEQEYHQLRHAELGTPPLRRFLDAPNVGRPCPDSQTLGRAFRGYVQRRQRRSDGTFTLAGRRFEVPARYRHLEQLSVGYRRWDLSAVELVDPHTHTPLCALYPLDKAAHAQGQRRRLPAPPTPTPTAAAPESSELPVLLRQLLADYAATGHPPAYLPKDDREEPAS
jgi:transposase InsO family protein